MKLRLAIFTFSLLPALALAQQRTMVSEPAAVDTDPRTVQIAAATANGIAKLRDQVLGTRLGRDLTVRDYLDHTRSTDDLNSILDSAQAVGGPRWVDAHTCQVQMELAGPKVSAFLIDVARDEFKHSELKPDALKARLADWKGLKFTGVGSSAGGDSIELARPHETAGKWSEVRGGARKRAIADARADAMQQAVKSIGPMMLDEKIPVSDALATPVISRRVNSWLQQQPVTKIEFLDDLKVSVTISVAPRLLVAELKSAVAADASFSRGLQVDWPKVTTQAQALPVAYAGTATAVVEGPVTTLPSIVLPITPPDWVDQQLDADGIARARGPRLKVGLLAENDAVGKLRQQFMELHIDANTTLAEAAKSDPALNQAVDRAMKHAHTDRAEYDTDGSVRVKMSLDLRDAWDELRSNP